MLASILSVMSLLAHTHGLTKIIGILSHKTHVKRHLLQLQLLLLQKRHLLMEIHANLLLIMQLLGK